MATARGPVVLITTESVSTSSSLATGASAASGAAKGLHKVAVKSLCGNGCGLGSGHPRCEARCCPISPDDLPVRDDPITHTDADGQPVLADPSPADLTPLFPDAHIPQTRCLSTPLFHAAPDSYWLNWPPPHPSSWPGHPGGFGIIRLQYGDVQPRDRDQHDQGGAMGAMTKVGRWG